MCVYTYIITAKKYLVVLTSVCVVTSVALHDYNCLVHDFFCVLLTQNRYPTYGGCSYKE